MQSTQTQAVKWHTKLALALLSSLPSGVRAQSTVEATAGEKFDNIQILADMPADQMGKVMNIMSASLGVNCSHCHQNFDFAQQGTAHKDTARKMLAMTFKLNQEHFDGKTVVTCNTCHRGQARPESELLPQLMLAEVAEQPATAPPKAEQIIATYLAKLGATEKLKRVKTRKVLAKRVEPDGRTEPETIWQTSLGKIRVLTQYGDVAVVEGYDGTRVWKTAQGRTIPLKADESEQIRREAALAFPLLAKDYFQEFSLQKIDRLAERNVYVLAAKNIATSEDRLFFDVNSGLLVRRTSSVPTVLGAFTYQIDYEAYQTFDEVLLPTIIHFSVPGIRWTRRVLNVESNTELDEMMFVGPQQ